MRPYTTPTHEFETDIDLTEASALYMTYKQDIGGCRRGCNMADAWHDMDTVLEKTIDDVRIEPDMIYVPLTQEETGKFKANHTVYIQCRVKFPDGSALASNIVAAGVEEVLKKGVI